MTTLDATGATWTNLPERTIEIVIPAFNAGRWIARTLDAVLEQEAPPRTRLQVIVVDDGSSDRTMALIQSDYAGRVRLVRHATNRGRGAALNSGSAAGSGDVVVFCDADCVYATRRVVKELVAAIDAGAAAALGGIQSTDPRFWGKYTNAVAENRARLADAGRPWLMTTANCAFRRAAFEALHGFNEAYRKYGFEDRDLLVRLIRHGYRAAIVAGATVEHEGIDDVRAACAKQQQSGEYSSTVFRENFPAEYLSMPYSKCDARSHGRLVTRLHAPLVALRPTLEALTQWLIDSPYMPYPLQAFSLKLVSALAYFHGTYLATVEHDRALGGDSPRHPSP